LTPLVGRLCAKCGWHVGKMYDALDIFQTMSSGIVDELKEQVCCKVLLQNRHDHHHHLNVFLFLFIFSTSTVFTDFLPNISHCNDVFFILYPILTLCSYGFKIAVINNVFALILYWCVHTARSLMFAVYYSIFSTQMPNLVTRLTVFCVLMSASQIVSSTVYF
jgi:hypothetical protein